ncbi:MAG: phosphoserine phosphatase SerB [Candidatus Nanopelagicales bacterium]
MLRTYLIVISGHDQPGITREVLRTLPSLDSIIDVQQILSEGMLTLHAVVRSMEEMNVIERSLLENLKPFSLDVSVHRANMEVLQNSPDQLVVTLMSPNLKAESLLLVTESILSLGGNIDSIERIATYPVTALEFRVSQGDIVNLRLSLSEIAITHHLDLAVQRGSLQRRGRHLIVLDVDSTLIQEEVIDLLGQSMGCEREIAEITEKTMRGDLDFESALRERVQLLTGMPASKLAEIYSSITLSPGARTLIRVLKYLDYNVVFVSGGFDFVVQQLAEELGADGFVANKLEILNGYVSGNLVGDIIDRSGKARALHDFAARFTIPMARTIAIGDGANDIDMLNLAGLGIAFNAKPLVQRKADTSINVPYLDSILYLLGITRLEIEQLNRELGINSFPPNQIEE